MATDGWSREVLQMGIMRMRVVYNHAILFIHYTIPNQNSIMKNNVRI